MAQSALSSKLKQELIDGVLASLEVAGKALDGKDSNVTALKEAMKATMQRLKLDDMLMLRKKYVELMIVPSKKSPY